MDSARQVGRSVNLYYDPSGIIDEFKDLILRVMHGTYFQEDSVVAFCPQTTPQTLASLVGKGDVKQVGQIAGIGPASASQLCQQFAPLDKRHALETIWKPPTPVIKVRTKGVGAKQISINQLSDGQKHTILLTIAMLAESNLPLVIDHPLTAVAPGESGDRLLATGPYQSLRFLRIGSSNSQNLTRGVL